MSGLGVPKKAVLQLRSSQKSTLLRLNLLICLRSTYKQDLYPRMLSSTRKPTNLPLSTYSLVFPFQQHGTEAVFLSIQTC